MTLTDWVLKTLQGFDTPITGLNLAPLKLIPRLSRQFACPSQFPLQSMITRLHTSLQLLRGQMHKNEENRIMKTAKGVWNSCIFIKSFLNSSRIELRNPRDIICGFTCHSPLSWNRILCFNITCISELRQFSNTQILNWAGLTFLVSYGGCDKVTAAHTFRRELVCKRLLSSQFSIISVQFLSHIRRKNLARQSVFTGIADILIEWKKDSLTDGNFSEQLQHTGRASSWLVWPFQTSAPATPVTERSHKLSKTRTVHVQNSLWCLIQPFLLCRRKD